MTTLDLRQLPQFSIIALLARHARRVRAKCDIPGDDPDRGRLMTAVDKAIQVAMKVAAGEQVPTSDVHQVAGEALDAADAALEVEGGSAAAKAAAFVAYAAASVGGNPPAILIHAQHCFESGDLPGTTSDFNKLLHLCSGQFPELGSAVDPLPTGPLGPV